MRYCLKWLEEGNYMRFTKMQGIGNDYLFINCFEEYVPDPSRLAVEMCREHVGVGADGIVLLEPGESSPFAMRIFNRRWQRG